MRSRVVTLATVGTILLTLATGAARAGESVEPFRIKGSSGISCLGTPFGKRIALGVDQEPVILRLQTNGALANYQLAGSALAFEREGPLNGVLAGADRIDSAPLDFDGDGREELAVVGGKLNGSFGLRIVRRNGGAANSNVQLGSYEWTNTGGASLLDLAIAGADLDGSRDGRKELVIAARWSNNVVRVIALSADASGSIAQPNNTAMALWTLPANEFNNTTNLRLTTGDVLLEGRDQIVLLSTQGNSEPFFAWTILRAAGDATGPAPTMSLTHRTFVDPFVAGQALADLQLHAGDLGGSAAAELLVHSTPQASSGVLESVDQLLRYFTTTRGPDNAILDYTLQTGGRNTVPGSGERFVAVAIGELDRRPDLEFVVARQIRGTAVMRVEAFKALFAADGFPTGVAPSTPGIALDVTLPVGDARLDRGRFDLAVGDADGDSIGDVFLVVRDTVTQSDSTPLTRVRRFAMARPANPNAFPDPASFALRSSFDFPTTFGDSRELQLQPADWDRDSVLADLDLAATCRRIREPLVRAVVNLPPYWERLQGNSSGFLATIGKTRTAGSSAAQRFDTFTSHDISAYIGAAVGGDFFGIGARATAKVTAGYNYEAARGELRESEVSTTTGESQQQDRGEGLVVVEENTFDCYDYQVLRDGVADPSSDLRACELIRRGSNNDLLRSFTATDLETWDTFTGDGAGVGGPPSQWMPLQPDWANIALFRPVSSSVSPVNGTQLESLTDGQFGTVVQTAFPAIQPYFQVDLGEVRDITSIRVFPEPGQSLALDGVRLYTSVDPMNDVFQPTGPTVRQFLPDPRERNGLDRWSVRTRGNAASGFAPLRARYVRVQQPTNAALRIAELQVFGDVHKDPPAFPQSVTDPARNDGLFRARVANLVAVPPRYVCIDVRGDLLWTGAPVDTSTDPVDAKFNCAATQLAPAPPAGQLPGAPFLTTIWGNVVIGGSGINAWDLTDSTVNTVGSSNAISHSARVGAEFDLEAGVIAQAVGGGAYAYSSGVTEENSTTMYWGQNLMYAGAVGGFAAGSNANCEYRAQPYAYRTSERSNIGYEHQYTVVAYVVRDFTWSRLGSNQPPPDCFAPRSDPLFGNGFE
jgi:hypothetical protein